MRTLILGHGSIGRRHALVLSRDLGHRVEVVTRREAPGFASFPDLAAAGDLDRFDYFVVASATHLHHAHLAALDAAVRDRIILVEKPLFFREARFATGRNAVFVGYNLRFHPALRMARDLLQPLAVAAADVQVGEYLPWWRPETDYRSGYSARRAEGGGVVLDLSHELDYVQWLFGPLTRLAALAGHWSCLEIDSDDYAAVLGVTARRVAVTVTMDYLSMVPVRTMLARAREGTVHLDLRQGRVTFGGPDRRIRTWDFQPEDRDHSYREMHRAVLEGEGRDVCTLAEGLAVMRTIQAIQRRNLAAPPPDGEGSPC